MEVADAFKARVVARVMALLSSECAVAVPVEERREEVEVVEYLHPSGGEAAQICGLAGASGGCAAYLALKWLTRAS